MKILPYLKLMRISALPTCWSNVLTAFWLADVCAVRLNGGLLALLLIVSSLFYLAGMVLNDVFDAKIDAVERPERPIPKGEISRLSAGILGIILLLFPCLIINYWAMCQPPDPRRMASPMAMFLCIFIVLYNFQLKHIPLIGATVMGLCRFFNILMVLFAAGGIGDGRIPIYAYSVLVYITAVTILSGYEAKSLFVRKLVGIGLSSIILIDAVWCLVFVGVVPALVVLALYPITMGLRRIVSMT